MLSLSFKLDLTYQNRIIFVITRDTRICILKTAERLVKNCSSVDYFCSVFELYSVVFGWFVAITPTECCESTPRGLLKHQERSVMVCSDTPRPYFSTPMSALQHSHGTTQHP